MDKYSSTCKATMIKEKWKSAAAVGRSLSALFTIFSKHFEALSLSRLT